MRPRRIRRGELYQVSYTASGGKSGLRPDAQVQASMRPRRIRRGERQRRRRALRFGRIQISFNAATARSAAVENALTQTKVQHRPRAAFNAAAQRRRGERLWPRQCVETGGASMRPRRIRRGEPHRRRILAASAGVDSQSFNAATANSPWRTARVVTGQFSRDYVVFRERRMVSAWARLVSSATVLRNSFGWNRFGSASGSQSRTALYLPICQRTSDAKKRSCPVHRLRSRPRIGEQTTVVTSPLEKESARCNRKASLGQAAAARTGRGGEGCEPTLL